MNLKNKGFTLIELLIVVAIIAILTSVFLLSINQSRKNARINGAKTSLKTIFPAIIACKDSGGVITPRVKGNSICNPPAGFSGAFWPNLPGGYTYGGGNYDSNICNFQIMANDVPSGHLTCDCVTQICK